MQRGAGGQPRGSRWSENLGWWLGSQPRRFRSVAVVTVISLVVYLVLRVTLTLPGSNPFAFWLLFSAEVFAVIMMVLFAYDTWSVRLPAPPSGAGRTADIVIATYDEARDVLEPTILASTLVRGVGQVWVLDDGRRDWVHDLCSQWGVRYVTRPNNMHAKAGNINNALPLMTADLLLFLDADHVPQRNAIEAMAGYFDDPRMAVVQSPHDFRNRDSVHQRSEYNHEQSLFFEVIMPGRTRDQASFWCGSAALIRREALVEVGGVAVETVSEDLHSTLRMQLRGYRVGYISERVISGLGPHNLEDYLLQRDRWARGTLSVLFSRESPVFGRGWTIRQRLHYMNSLLHYFIGLQRLAFVVAILLVLLAGVLPIGALPPWLLALALLNIVLTTVASLGLARGRIGLGDGVGNAWLTAEIFLAALGSAILRRPTRFRVTPKEAHALERRRVLSLLRLPVTVGIAITIAWILRAVQQVFPDGVAGVRLPGTLALDLFLVLTFFVALELATILVVIVREMSRRQSRALWRFSSDAPGRLGDHDVTVVDLHSDGAHCEGSEQLAERGDVLPFTIDIDADGHERRCRGELTVQRAQQTPDGSWHAAGTVLWASEADRHAVMDYCYVHLASRGRARRGRLMSDVAHDGD